VELVLVMLVVEIPIDNPHHNRHRNLWCDHLNHNFAQWWGSSHVSCVNAFKLIANHTNPLCAIWR
jgi:hypothetical protein